LSGGSDEPRKDLVSLYQPTQFPHYQDGVPDELKRGACWVCCDEDKVPMIPLVRGWRRAKSSDPNTWRSYAEALAAFKTGRYAGVGRVFRKRDALVGVDLDHCRDPETGSINARARRILDALDSYGEVSPSATGIKLWIRADLKRAFVKPGLEVYPRGQYFCVTGQILPQYPATVEERSEVLGAVLAEEFLRKPKPERRSVPRAGDPLNLPAFLAAGGVDVLGEIADGEAEIKFGVLCPWIDEHTTSPESGCFVGQYPSGACFFWCWHSHCRHREWRDFWRRVRPRESINLTRGRKSSGGAEAAKGAKLSKAVIRRD
jgi:hypothetical protein